MEAASHGPYLLGFAGDQELITRQRASLASAPNVAICNNGVQNVSEIVDEVPQAVQPVFGLFARRACISNYQ